MSTISKERVAGIASGEKCYTHDDVVELARIALASLEAEAVCVIDQSNLDYLKSGSDADVWPASRTEMGDVLLYRAAPPSPVVPDLKELETILDWILMLPCPTPKATHFAKRLAVVIETSRAAMLKQPSSIQGRDDAVSDSEIKQPSSNVQLSGVTEQLEPASQTYRLRDGLAAIRKLGPIDAEKIQAERDALNEPTCWCLTCRPVTMTDMRFVVCPDCGNKRCPHANDHRHACTGSNEPGQEGSAYPAAPQQEVTQALAKGMERYGDAMQELAQREMK